MDLKTAFPKLAGNVTKEQRFTIGQDTSIAIITLDKQCVGILAGIVVLEGDFKTGYFHQRKYAGNSLRNGKINPIKALNGTYDLYLTDKEIEAVSDLLRTEKPIASFSFHEAQRWSLVTV